jgi:hypothetical protein
MGHASQNKVLSTLRGTEVVADPTNVMALECARRMRRDPTAVVRLATSHRCVRAQPIPKRLGLSANFRIFCLASAGLERQNHAFVVEAMAEHIKTMLHALDHLEQHGFTFPERRLTLLTRDDTAALGDRIVAMLGDAGGASPPRASVLQQGLALSDRSAFERRSRDAARRRRRLRLGGETHIQP